MIDYEPLVKKIQDRINKEGFVMLPTYYKLVKVLEVWNERNGVFMKAQGYKKALALTICQVQYLAQ